MHKLLCTEDNRGKAVTKVSETGDSFHKYYRAISLRLAGASVLVNELLPKKR